MRLSSVETVVRSLNDAGVRYLIAGGLAVVAHGYVRFTADVDLVIDLEMENVQKAIAVFEKLGYMPRAPVPAAQFADAAHRERWLKEKNMQVFSLASSLHPLTEIDLFIEMPFDFGVEWKHAVWQEIGPGVLAPFISLPQLIAMKEKAGRQRDKIDLENLRKINDGTG